MSNMSVLKLFAMIAVCCAPAARAETYTMDAYYPSPAGVYRTVTVTSTTVLARDGGNVNIGTSARPAELDLRGNARVSGVVVPGRLAEDPWEDDQKVDGAIYFNTTAMRHRMYKGGVWTDLVPSSSTFFSNVAYDFKGTVGYGSSGKLTAGVWYTNTLPTSAFVTISAALYFGSSPEQLVPINVTTQDPKTKYYITLAMGSGRHTNDSVLLQFIIPPQRSFMVHSSVGKSQDPFINVMVQSVVY